MSAGTFPGDLRLLVPVKSLALAKSRLSLSPHARRRIAEGLLTHTLEVALQCLPARQIVVLSADGLVQDMARQRGVSTLEDPADCLNASLHWGIHTLRSRCSGLTIAVLVADLPRLSPPNLHDALHDAAESRVPRHIADHHGTGTTFVSIPPGSQLPMLFGPGSARRFAEAGSVPILHAPEGLRHDLDTESDLHALASGSTREACRLKPLDLQLLARIGASAR